MFWMAMTHLVRAVAQRVYCQLTALAAILGLPLQQEQTAQKYHGAPTLESGMTLQHSTACTVTAEAHPAPAAASQLGLHT